MVDPLLLPPPRRLERTSGGLTIGASLQVDGHRNDELVEPAIGRLETVLAPHRVELVRGEAVGDGARLRLELEPSTEADPESYRLRVDPSGIRLAAATAAGLSHGLSTLTQWIRIHPPDKTPQRRLAGVEIRDRPDLPRRGVLVDISRCRVPTMETLFDLVEMLAGWKLNELQLYTEHTFAYRGHETVWEDASPLTPEEVRRLDDFCRRRHVDLVPNQNSCGHLHRWLVHEPYRRLAECPDGIEHPFSRRPEPFGLCTTDPAALALLEELYDQLLPCFSSRLFHVGLDETIDLGRCRSRQVAERLGTAELYRRFLCQIHQRVTARRHRMQFWGDIVADQPELLPELPTDVIVMEWGYEAGHEFDTRAARLAAAGLDFYLCPGTSSWLSFAGRLENARRNVAAAARAAQRYGAEGLLITDWGDQGHLQPLPASFPGLALGAALSWSVDSAHRPETIDVGGLLATHLLPARSSEPRLAAHRLLTLADLYRLAGGRSFNASPLFYLLVRPDLPLSDRRLDGLRSEALENCLEVLREIPGGADTPAGAPLVDREIAWMRDALEAGARVGLGRLGAGLEGDRSLLASVDSLIARHADLWDARSRPGGRTESLSHLERARRRIAREG